MKHHTLFTSRDIHFRILKNLKVKIMRISLKIAFCVNVVAIDSFQNKFVFHNISFEKNYFIGIILGKAKHTKMSYKEDIFCISNH